jgi:hypothetical protein
VLKYLIAQTQRIPLLFQLVIVIFFLGYLIAGTPFESITSQPTVPPSQPHAPNKAQTNTGAGAAKGNEDGLPRTSTAVQSSTTNSKYADSNHGEEKVDDIRGAVSPPPPIAPTEVSQPAHDQPIAPETKIFRVVDSRGIVHFTPTDPQSPPPTVPTGVSQPVHDQPTAAQNKIIAVVNSSGRVVFENVPQPVPEPPAQNLTILRQNLAQCLNGYATCDRSLLTPDQTEQVHRSDLSRNLQACLNGYATCDRRLLASDQTEQVHRSDLSRNLQACLNGYATCDRRILTSDQTEQVHRSDLSRNLQACLNGYVTCDRRILTPEELADVDQRKRR